MSGQETKASQQSRNDGSAGLKPQGDKLEHASGNAIESDTLSSGSSSVSGESSADRQERIAKAAYSRAEKRGFAPGSDWDDWLSAEREIDGAGDRQGAEAPDRDI